MSSSDGADVLAFPKPKKPRKPRGGRPLEEIGADGIPATDEELVTLHESLGPSEREHASMLVAAFLRGQDELYELVIRRAIEISTEKEPGR